MKQITKKRSQQLADCIVQPIITVIDLAIQTDPTAIDDLVELKGRIEHQTSMQRAMPFPETQDAADDGYARLNTLTKIIELLETRQELITVKHRIKKNKDDYFGILKAMGAI